MAEVPTGFLLFWNFQINKSRLIVLEKIWELCHLNYPAEPLDSSVAIHWSFQILVINKIDSFVTNKRFY